MWWSLRSFVGQAPGCRGAGLTHGNRTVQFGILDGPFFVTPDVGPAFLVLHHKDVEGGLRAPLRLAPFVLLPLSILWAFGLDHARWPLFSYDDLLTLGRLGLRWLNQDLLPIELDHVHVHRERVLVKLHLGIFCKFQPSFIYGRLKLSTENVAIVSSMRIRIMKFTIRMLLELFQ
jgi:hypothetical protein